MSNSTWFSSKLLTPPPNWDGLLELGTAGVLCWWYRQCVKIYERNWLLDCSDIIDYLEIAWTLLQDDYLETPFILYRPQLRTSLAAPTILIRAGELDIRYNILTTWCGRLARSLSHVSAVRHVPYVVGPSHLPLFLRPGHTWASDRRRADDVPAGHRRPSTRGPNRGMFVLHFERHPSEICQSKGSRL